MSEQNEKEIKEKLLLAAKDGRIKCPDCLAISKEFNVKGTVIGRLCNQLKLKICGCQLGCFR